MEHSISKFTQIVWAVTETMAQNESEDLLYWIYIWYLCIIEKFYFEKQKTAQDASVIWGLESAHGKYKIVCS